MGGDTVVGVQGVEYWAEDTSLWSAGVVDDPGWGFVPNGPDKFKQTEWVGKSSSACLLYVSSASQVYTAEKVENTKHRRKKDVKVDFQERSEQTHLL